MKWFLYFSLILILYSCQKESTVSEPDPSGFFSKLKVNVFDCKTIQCDELESVVGLNVELYKTYDDAKDQVDRVTQVQVCLEGQSIFTVSNITEVYIRLRHPTKGVYISSERLNPQVLNAFHEIRFVANFIYNNNDELLVRQSHISFDFPAYRQESHYAYHFQEDTLNLLKPLAYENVSLVILLKQQILENEFLVREKFSVVPEYLNQVYENVHESIWTFNSNSISIEPVVGTTVSSPLFGIVSNTTSEMDPLIISLNACESQPVDIENSEYNSIDWKECMHVESYSLKNQVYEDISLFHKRIDNEIVIIIFYSTTDGVLRSLEANLNSNSTYGYDLVL